MRRKAKLYLTTLCLGIGVGIALLGLAVTSVNVNAEGETLIHKPGTTSTVTNLPEPTLLVGGTETAVSDLVPEREGFEFMGWVLDYKLQTSYTVKYLNKATNEPLAAEKTMTGLEVGASIAESAIVIDGYEALDPTEVTIELAESDNEIIFWYEEDAPTHTSYVVKYLDAVTGDPVDSDKVVTDVEIGSTVREYAIGIDGYEALDPTEVTIELAESDNEIIFWYFWIVSN